MAYPYNFATYEEAYKYYTDSVPEANDTISFIPSCFTHPADPLPYRRDINQATTTAEKSAILNQYVQDSLYEAVPIIPTLWLISSTNIKKAIDFFKTSQEATALERSLIRFRNKGADCSWNATGTFIEGYRTMCSKFRDFMKFEAESMATLHEGVLKEFVVDQNNIQTVRQILVELKKRRDASVNSANKGTGCPHYEEYMGYIDDLKYGITQPQMGVRNNSKLGGYTVTREFDPSIGQLLLSTALMKHKQLGHDIERVIDLFPVNGKEQVKLEIKLLEDNSGTGNKDGPYQQVAGIDSIVSSAFWLFKVAKIETLEDFQICSQILYKIGLSPKGRVKVVNILKKCTIPSIVRLVNSFSNCTNIYLPPFVITPSRLEEIYATYSTISPFNVDTINNPCVTWKTLLNIRHSNLFWRFMGNYFQLDMIVNPANDDILSSLHAFHQTILSKTSAFQNTHNVNGDAFSIMIIPE